MPKLRAILIALTAVVTGAASVRAQSTPPGFRDEFLDQFRSSTSRLIALARAMPEEKYAWSPGAGVMPVAQVYAHIARYNYYYPQTGLGVAVPEGIDLESMEATTAKAEVIALLERSVEHVATTIPRIPDSQLGEQTELYGRQVAQWAVLFQLLAHMNEHLGQSIAYARSNGVVPPWSR